MAYNFKKINDVPVVEAMKSDLNVFVEDSGKMAKISANKMIPEDVALKSDIPTKVSELENDAVIPVPVTAEVGQVVAVKAVDENGKPTEWEAVDMSSGYTVLFPNNAYLCHFDAMTGPGEPITREEFINIVKTSIIYLGFEVNDEFDLTRPITFSLNDEYGSIVNHEGNRYYTAEWVDSGPV